MAGPLFFAVIIETVNTKRRRRQVDMNRAQRIQQCESLVARVVAPTNRLLPVATIDHANDDVEANRPILSTLADLDYSDLSIHPCRE